jgi:putative tryptophan/tyrosine transport system substrate-binding protein
MKRLGASPFVFFLTLILSQLVFADIAVVKTAGVLAFDEARNGFASTCFENKQEFDLSEDLSNKDEIIKGLKSGNFRLIVAIGSQAASFVKSNFPDIPEVFTMVVNPDRMGLTGNNATGVALDVPIREELLILKSIAKKARRIGVIYTQPANDTLINSLRSVASETDFVVVPEPINSSADLQKAMTDLIGKCDALWIPPDPSLNSEDVVRYIGSTSLSKQLPCVGPTDRYVRSGAIFSLAADAVEAGKLAGDLANQILQGTAPSKLAIQTMSKPRIIINLKAAELLGLTIPKNVQNSASKIYQ